MVAREISKLDIWEEFSLTNDVELRNRLILEHLYLVKIIVGRLIPEYQSNAEYDDFISYGILGLMDAIEKFDYTKGVKFETYASIRIKGAIIDNIREHDWISTYLRQKLKKLDKAFEYLEREYGRPATEAEVAKYLNISTKELKKLLVDAHAANIIYFDQLLSSSIEIGASDNKKYVPEECFEQKELRNILKDKINLLSEREKIVITLYYFEELSLKEIGIVLGVSESRVSQIHSKALIRLRTAISRALYESKV